MEIYWDWDDAVKINKSQISRSSLKFYMHSAYFRIGKSAMHEQKLLKSSSEYRKS